MIGRIISFLKAEWNHVYNSMTNQTVYQLQEEIKSLEKSYENSKSDLIWNMMEEKKQSLAKITETKRLRDDQ